MSTQPVLYQVEPSMMDLSGEEVGLFNLLIATWQRHYPGNERNEAYYAGMVRPVSVETTAPEELRNLDVVVGWGTKAVDALAGRSVLSGFTGDGAQELSDALGGIDMTLLYQQAITSCLTDSCAFLAVSHGLPGEPDALVSAIPALDAAAVWDERRKRIRAGIAVIDVEETEGGLRVPSWVTMYTDEATYSCRRIGERWYSEKANNPLGRPLIEPLAHRPSLTRPFGKSRITRTVRSLIDRAMCVCARTEVSAVFYTWPQRYFLGVDRKQAESIADRKMELYPDRTVIVSTNKNGDTPQYGQLSQMSMQPHTEHLQTLAKQFASEASIPLDEVGIVFDNPSSSDAMYAAQGRLIIEAEGVNRMAASALRAVGRMAIATARGSGLDGVPDVRAEFENPIRPSMAARADFALKVASTVPEYAQTSRYWRDLGYSEGETAEIMREVRQAQAVKAAANAAALLAARTSPPEPEGAEVTGGGDTQ